MAKTQSLEVAGEFWQRVEALIHQHQRLESRNYIRKTGEGRKPKEPRLVFDAIVYVLRTGCQWKALPAEHFGNASAVHGRLLERGKVGMCENLRCLGLAEYDEMEGIA